MKKHKQKPTKSNNSSQKTKNIIIAVLAISLAAALTVILYLGVSGRVANEISTYTQSSDGLDYAHRDNWYQLPPDKKPGGLNVFVVYPTVTANGEKEPYILNQNDPEMLAGVEAFMAQSISPIFDGLNVNLFVPKYRQYNGAYYTNNSYSQAFSEISGVPRTDIYNAFDYFLKNYNSGNDYLIIGHSRGAALTSFLVSDFATRFMSKSTQDKMSLAVIAGWGLIDTTLQNSPYKFSQSPTDKNVIVSWNTATLAEVKGNYDRFTWGDQTTVSTNPTTFTSQPSDTAQVVRPAELGGAFPGQVLLVNKPESDYTTPAISQTMDKANLGYAHLYDLALFSDEIRSNLKLRLGI
jgi:hypothetical protein